MKDQIEERSSQLLCNLSSCEKKAWKKFRLERDSNPWPLRCRCSALPSAVQIYVSHIYIHLFILHGYITNSQYDQLPVGLIAQLVEHCTGIAEVMGSNPVQAWIFSGFLFASQRSWVRIPFKPEFFQAFFSQLLKLHSNSEDLSSIWTIPCYTMPVSPHAATRRVSFIAITRCIPFFHPRVNFTYFTSSGKCVPC